MDEAASSFDPPAQEGRAGIAAPTPAWVSQVLETITDSLFVLDREWRFVYLNSQALRDSRQPAAELLGRSLWEKFPALRGTPLETHYRQAMAEQTPAHFEMRGLLSGRWLDVHAYPSPEGLVAYSRDASARKRAEEALRDREARLRLLLEQMPAILWATDAELRVTSSVGAGLARHGLRPGELVGRPLAECLGPEGERHPGMAAHRRALAGNSQGYEAVWQGASYQVYVEPLRDEAGQVVGCIGACLDVTERKQAEAQLRAYAREVLAVQERERRRVACELHGELGQDLTALRIILDLARQSPADHLPERLDEAQRLVRELTGKVRDLSLRLRPSMLDDLGLLPALLWYMERYTAQTGVVAAFEHCGLEARLPAAVETGVYRIVQEALTNVARHAGVGRCVVAIRRDGGLLHLHIRDNGRGFNATAGTWPPSTGLSGMRERATLAGGRLTVEAAPGQGTQIIVELPIQNEAEAARDPGSTLSGVPSGGVAPVADERVTP